MSKSLHKRLFLCDLEVDGEGNFFVHDKKVYRVDVYGTVSSLRLKERATLFEIDDTTGLIECVSFAGEENGKKETSSDESAARSLHEILIKPKPSLKLGDLVNVHGRLNFFREQPQIIANTLRIVADFSEERFRAFEIKAEQSYSKAESLNSCKPKIQKTGV